MAIRGRKFQKLGLVESCTVKDWENYLDSVAVSLSVGIQGQVVHGTFEIIAIDL